jgi:hypothetical protein
MIEYLLEHEGEPTFAFDEFGLLVFKSEKKGPQIGDRSSSGATKRCRARLHACRCIVGQSDRSPLRTLM